MPERNALIKKHLTRQFPHWLGAIKAKDDAAMAAEFQNVIPVFEKLGEIAAKVVK